MKKQIESLIYQYHWRKKEADRLERLLFGRLEEVRSVGVAQYGVDAIMPKSNTSLKSRYEEDAMDRRERRLYERYEKFSEIVHFVESIDMYLRNDEEGIIYDCMLEGMSYRSIALHLGVSVGTLHNMKGRMLNHLCKKIQNERFEHFEQIVVDFTNQKSVC